MNGLSGFSDRQQALIMLAGMILMNIAALTPPDPVNPYVRFFLAIAGTMAVALKEWAGTPQAQSNVEANLLIDAITARSSYKREDLQGKNVEELLLIKEAVEKAFKPAALPSTPVPPS